MNKIAKLNEYTEISNLKQKLELAEANVKTLDDAIKGNAAIREGE